MPFASSKAIRKQKTALEERCDCADTHHGVASGVRCSIEQQRTSCVVEFSTAVEYSGRGRLIGLWWSLGWRKSQDVVLVSGLFPWDHETERSPLSSLTKHSWPSAAFASRLPGKAVVGTNGAVPSISNPADKTLHVFRQLFHFLRGASPTPSSSETEGNKHLSCSHSSLVLSLSQILPGPVLMDPPQVRLKN